MIPHLLWIAGALAAWFSHHPIAWIERRSRRGEDEAVRKWRGEFRI